MLTNRAGVGFHAQIVQRQDLLFRQILIAQPCLIVVREGRKLFESGTEAVMVQAGEAIALQAGQLCNVTNHVGKSGCYRASVFAFEAAAIARIGSSGARLSAHLGVLGAGFQDTLDRAAQGILLPLAIPETVARHRMEEVLLWMAERGWAFSMPDDLGLADRVRRLIAGALAEEWAAQKVAAHFAMSETTLRRRLADEGEGLREILQEVRMNAALAMLQSTELQVGQIAAALGYASASRFAVRFGARFGFAPAQVRGHKARRRA